MIDQRFSSSPREHADRFHSEADGRDIETPMTSEFVTRLMELELQTERAAQLTDQGRYKSAMASWSRVALLAESIFGRVDESVLDAMRILASIMSRLGLHDDGLLVLREQQERLFDAGLGQSARFDAINSQMKELRARRDSQPRREVAAFGASKCQSIGM